MTRPTTSMRTMMMIIKGDANDDDDDESEADYDADV